MELLTYAIRDLAGDIVYVPNETLDKAVKLTYIEGYDFQVGEKADPRGSDVVLLRGLAMPMSRVTAEAVLKMVEEISKRGHGDRSGLHEHLRLKQLDERDTV